MKRFTRDSAVLLGLTFVATALIACPATLDDRCADGACVPTTTSKDGTDGTKDGDPPDVPTPPGCKEDADANSPEAKGCVVDSFALFVDGTNGDDSFESTTAKPLKTIGSAVAKVSATGKRRIYVCGAGPYAEHLKLTTAVSIFGGFACGAWTYDGTKAKVSPSDKGYVLHVDNVSTPIAFSDLELVAPDLTAAKDGTSSIAAFVNKANVKFLRTVLAAGAAADGADGAPGTTGELTAVSSGAKTLNGNAATGTTGGSLKECTCSTGPETSRGGLGGAPTGGGGPGLPDLGASLPNNGAPGSGDVPCSPNGNGHNGAPALPAASAAKIATRGVLNGDGWQPQPGVDATESGKPGQGGGGGGGRDVSSAGGGGGCGGCGGTPGKGGQGGGASIALLINESVVSLAASTVSTKAGGAGGTGGTGGLGGPGGTTGAFTGGGCSGGEGGRGGDGGGGGGGAGGLSVAILHRGAPPTLDAETQVAISIKTAGLGGQGGKSPDNDGPPGLAEKIKDASQL